VSVDNVTNLIDLIQNELSILDSDEVGAKEIFTRLLTHLRHQKSDASSRISMLAIP
jgi:hypothetical protein